MHNSNDKGVVRDADAANAIGKKLRKMYDEVVDEPLPDEFVDLLNQLGESGDGQDNGDKK